MPHLDGTGHAHCWHLGLCRPRPRPPLSLLALSLLLLLRLLSLLKRRLLDLLLLGVSLLCICRLLWCIFLSDSGCLYVFFLRS